MCTLLNLQRAVTLHLQGVGKLNHAKPIIKTHTMHILRRPACAAVQQKCCVSGLSRVFLRQQIAGCPMSESAIPIRNIIPLSQSHLTFACICRCGYIQHVYMTHINRKYYLAIYLCTDACCLCLPFANTNECCCIKLDVPQYVDKSHWVLGPQHFLLTNVKRVG